MSIFTNNYKQNLKNIYFLQFKTDQLFCNLKSLISQKNTTNILIHNTCKNLNIMLKLGAYATKRVVAPLYFLFLDFIAGIVFIVFITNRVKNVIKTLCSLLFNLGDCMKYAIRDVKPRTVKITYQRMFLCNMCDKFLLQR